MELAPAFSLVAREISSRNKKITYQKRKNFFVTLTAGQFWWGAKPLKRYQRCPKVSLSKSEIYCKVQMHKLV